MHHTTYKRTLETRERLLDAILSLVREKGYPHVTVRDICRRAQVSSGAFYHHYASKDDLAREASFHIDRLVTADVEDACNRLPPVQALRKLLELQIHFVSQKIGLVILDYYRILLDGICPSELQPDRPYYQAISRQLQRCWNDGLLTTDRPLGELVDYCMLFLRGLIFHWALQRCSYSLPDRFTRDFPLLTQGLLCVQSSETA